MQCPPHINLLLLLTSLRFFLSSLPLSFSLTRLRWTACPACSDSFSAATTSPGKSVRRLTPSCPECRDRDGGGPVPRHTSPVPRPLSPGFWLLAVSGCQSVKQKQARPHTHRVAVQWAVLLPRRCRQQRRELRENE